MNVRFSDEQHVWIDGKQYIRLDRFLHVIGEVKEEAKILHDKCVELTDKNNTLEKMLKISLSTEGGPEYE